MEKRLTLAAAALALIAIGLLPVLAMVANTFYVAGEFSLMAYQVLLASGKQLTLLMGRSVLLSASVTFIAMVVGVPLGVLLGRTDLPLRGHVAHFAVTDSALCHSSGMVCGARLNRVDRKFLVAHESRIPVLDIFWFVRLHRCAIHRIHARRHAADSCICGDSKYAAGTSRPVDEPLAPSVMANHSAIDRSGHSICGCVGFSSYAWRSRCSHLFALPGVPS